MQLRFPVLISAFAAIASIANAAGLPLLTSTADDFEYGTLDNFTAYSPAGAPVSLFNNSLLLYGTPASVGGQPRELETFNIVNADVCYSLICPSITPLYPQPNYVLSLGSLNFAPNSILAGTGVNYLTTSFSVSGTLFAGAAGPARATISAAGQPILYTGDDPGGLTSYAYFLNADGTTSNVLHVARDTTSNATIVGVILDPPNTLILDILGFSNPSGNAFITAATPEPATWALAISALLFLIIAGRVRLSKRSE